MYRKHYGLTADPFRLSPDQAFCLPHRSFAKAKAYMRYAMHRGEGFVMITGAPGTGKTTLIDDLLAGVRESEFSIARLVSAQVEADDILRMVAAEFGLSAGRMEKSELLRLLSNLFTSNFKQGKRSLLIVDEAQGLGLSALEELRLLTNFRNGGQPMLQIFLVGQEELRDMVTSPELEQLNQRMIAAYHMEPLKPNEFVAYVLHRLTVAGWKGNPGFKPNLFPELFRFSNGLPRRINHICSRLLLHGFLEEKAVLDAADMEIVIKELRAEHYAIKECASFITQDKFNPDDLQRMAQSAMSRQQTTASVATSKQEQTGVIIKPNFGDERHPAPEPAMLEEGVETAAAVAKGDQQSGSDEIAPKVAAQVVSPEVDKTSIGQADGRGRGEPKDIGREIRNGERRNRIGKYGIRVSNWGVAIVVTVGVPLLLLISVPSQQLNQVASQSLWKSIGLTGIRDQISNWSGGRLPLRKTERSASQPVTPVSIKQRNGRDDSFSKQALGKLESTSETMIGDRPTSQLHKEALGETAPVLSESGAQLFR